MDIEAELLKKIEEVQDANDFGRWLIAKVVLQAIMDLKHATSLDRYDDKHIGERNEAIFNFRTARFYFEKHEISDLKSHCKILGIRVNIVQYMASQWIKEGLKYVNKYANL